MTPRREGPGAKKQQGIALFQVLVLTTILALLGLTFASEAREKIAQAQALEDRVRADLVAHSGEALAIFYSLSPNAAADQTMPCGDVSGTGSFNWHGAPLCPALGLRIRLQDLSGLLPLGFPNQPLWRPTLGRLGLNEDAQDVFLGTLADAQDHDGKSFRAGEHEPESLPSGRYYANGPLQRHTFLRALTADPRLFVELAPLTQLSGVLAFNPRFAPEFLLRAAYGDAQGSAFLRQRDERSLDLQTLRSQAPEFQDRELLSFSTSGSNYLRVEIEARAGNARQHQELLVQLTPRADLAYRLLQRLRH